MVRPRLRVMLPVLVGGLAVVASDATAQTKMIAGETRPHFATTPHPYPLGDERRPVVWTDIVRSDGATWLRLHFQDFDLATGDYVTIHSPGGQKFYRYEGRGPYGNGDFWSFSTEGDTAIVQLHGGRNMGLGYTITEIGHGTLPTEGPVLEVVCGSNGMRDVACYTDYPWLSHWNPVARLLFNDGTGWYVCTGFLVAGQNDSTLMTNNHCIGNQTTTNTLEARFNYQKKSCKGKTLESYINYNGGTFLRTSDANGGLDYTLLTLLGNPEASWGEYIPSTVVSVAVPLFWLPQHPGGNPKKLGRFEDSKQKIICYVYSYYQTYLPAAPGTQMNYGCDTDVGSSGSPLLRRGPDPDLASPMHVFGLHHYGGVTSCSNAATMMGPICQDAGALLNCVSD